MIWQESILKLDRQGVRNLAFAALAIVGVTFIFRLVAPSPASAPDFTSGNPGPEVTIDISQGESGSEIARKLFESGVTKSQSAFFRIAVADPRSARIAPGTHRVQTKISARDALNQLLDPDRITNLLRIRDGVWLSEVKAALKERGYSTSEIASAIKTVRPPANFNAPSLEGFLYPAFYPIENGASAESILRSMVSKFEDVTKNINWTGNPRFTPFQILTIASLVESEGTPDVHGKVARVIFNRLEKGMPLQLDSTVHYILARRGEIRVSNSDTSVANRYNTFLNRGLPPGPIASPTLDSIQATLAPPAGAWLYFVTTKPGTTKFTDSYQEFLSFKAEYKANFAKGLFK